MINLEKKAKEWIFALAEARIEAVKRYKHKADKHVSENLLIHLAIAAKFGDYNRVLSLMMGCCKEHQTDMNLREIVLKELGHPQLPAIVLHPAGELKSWYNFKHGVLASDKTKYLYSLIGDYLEVHKNGHPKKRTCFDDHGYEHGEHFEFDHEGLVTNCVSFNHGKAIGESYVIEEGTIGVMKSAVYENGVLDGVYTEIYQNKKQQKKKELWYTKGKADGPLIEYYPDGTIKTSGHYADNKMEGRFLEFDIDGKELTVSEYKNNLRHGDLIRHTKDIKGIKHQAHYQSGILDGNVTTLFLTPDSATDEQHYVSASVMFNLGIPDLS